MCKLASGHFSLNVCPFRYFSQPLGTQASTTTLRRKWQALRDVVEPLEGTEYLHSFAHRGFKPVPVEVRRDPRVCRSDKTPHAEAAGQRYSFLGFSTAHQSPRG